MRHNADNGIKNRLIDPSPMAAEVMRLLARGIPKDRVAIELSRLFYVDIDLLNAILKKLPEPAAANEPETADSETDGTAESDRAAA